MRLDVPEAVRALVAFVANAPRMRELALDVGDRQWHRARILTHRNTADGNALRRVSQPMEYVKTEALPRRRERRARRRRDGRDFANRRYYSSVLNAVNKAGRQRMLSQRIVKSYLQLADNVAANDARADLADALWLFERELKDLSDAAARLGFNGALNEVSRRWSPFRALVTEPPSIERVPALCTAGEALLL